MFAAMIKKEFLLVFRDWHALLALFVLPAIFILIMSVAMRDQFSTKNIEFTLSIEDADKTQMSKTIITNLKKDKSFVLSDDKENVQFIVKIPKEYAKNSKKLIQIKVQNSLKSDEIEVFKVMLSKHIIKTRIEAITKSLNKYAPTVSTALASLEVSPDKLYEIKYNNLQKIPNSTQQSVPAWIVFGMFFIIIPMSTIYINERKQNTLARLTSMNVSIFAMTLSKSIPYLVINQIQVWIMLGVGIFIVPLFNTPALELNGSILAIIAISTALSISAIGISNLIAVSANSSEQATTVGGILNILLGAVGGVMVPKFVMPESMQRMAELSPMSWGLDGFLDIFLKSSDTGMILDNILKLVAFGLVALLLSMLVLKIRINRGL